MSTASLSVTNLIILVETGFLILITAVGSRDNSESSSESWVVEGVNRVGFRLDQDDVVVSVVVQG